MVQEKIDQRIWARKKFSDLTPKIQEAILENPELKELFERACKCVLMDLPDETENQNENISSIIQLGKMLIEIEIKFAK